MSGGYQLFQLTNFLGGLNVDTADLSINQLLVAQNVDIDATGSLSKRSGSQELVAPAALEAMGSNGINAIMEYSGVSIAGKKLVFCQDGVMKLASHATGQYPVIDSIANIPGGTLTNSADRPTFAPLANRVIISTEHDSHYLTDSGIFVNGIQVAVLADTAMTQSVTGSGVAVENVQCEFQGTPRDGFNCVGKRVSTGPDTYDLYTNTADNVLVLPADVGDISQVTYTIVSSSGRNVPKTFDASSFTVTKGASKVTVTMNATFDDSPGWITNVVVTPPDMAEFKYKIESHVATDIASVSNVTGADGNTLTLATDYTIATEGEYQYILLTAKPASYGAIFCTVTPNPDKATFMFSATYVKSGDYEIETNGFLTSSGVYPSKELSVGSGYNAIIAVPRSTDSQVDKIRLYVSSAGGDKPYFVKEVANPISGDSVTTLTQAEIEAVSGVEIPNDNFTPPNAKYVLSKGSRVFYANTNDAKIGRNTVKWSNLNDSSSIGASSFQTFAPESGDEITGLGSLLSYVVVFTRNRTWLLDCYDFGKIDLDGGCLSHWSIQSVLDGAAVAYLSDSGICVCDGQTNKSITFGKIDSLIKRYVDMSLVATKTSSSYNRVQKKYTVYLPKIGGGQVVFSCFMGVQGAPWTEYVLPEEVTAACSINRDDGSDSIVQCSKDGTTGYILESEYRPDMLNYTHSTDHANGTTEAPITMNVMTIPLDFGVPGVTKRVRRLYLNWTVTANKEAKRYNDSGANADPGHAHIKVFSDMASTLECSQDLNYVPNTVLTSATFPSSVEQLLGRRRDRVNLRGADERLIFSFDDSSDNNITLFSMNFMYYALSQQGVPQAAFVPPPTV